jgi:predicted HicB family RNase H-like nuclease
MIITTLALDPDMHRRATRAAFDERATLAQFIREALFEHLKRKGSKLTGGYRK